MCKELTPWEKCVEFHGHICPGLSIGFKAAVIALNQLGVSRAGDEELVTIVENDACGVDAVQVLTGCTIGKGNLIYRDYGKQVYTIGNRKTGEAVRVAVKPDIMGRDPEHRRLMDLVMRGEATAERYMSISGESTWRSHKEFWNWLMRSSARWKKLNWHSLKKREFSIR